MTRECGLEAPAQYHAVQERDHRFAAAFKPQQQVVEQRLERRMLELANVGAGYEISASSVQHDRCDRRIFIRGHDGFHQARAHWLRQCIHRRVIDGDERQMAAALERYGFTHELTRSVTLPLTW